MYLDDEKEQINDLSEREARIVEAGLRLEQRRLSAGEVYRDEHPEFLRDYYADEPEETKKLKRELEREALMRLEDAARTEADFREVVKIWDRLDRNRERKERYHEIPRWQVPLEYNRAEGGGYFALRTVTLWEAGGHTRLCLNGEPVYLHGVLDQGYFQDGLFLPAEPEEYERDILRMKELGFNTLRKHVKLEPEAFYAACDRLGMLVLQDMVNAGEYHRFRDTILPNLGFTRRNDNRAVVTKRQAEQFEANVRGTIERLRSHPCVVGYTIFNEGWGQYDSDGIYRDCKRADPTRVFISASGWFAGKESDARSCHVYLKTKVLKPAGPGRFLILSECGGFSRRVKGHVMKGRRNYGYGRRQDTEEELTGKIADLYNHMVLPSMDNGLCGSIYTQLSDVEGETNGLYTYDRQVCKVTKSSLLEIAKQLKVRFDDLVGRKMY